MAAGRVSLSDPIRSLSPAWTAALPALRRQFLSDGFIRLDSSTAIGPDTGSCEAANVKDTDSDAQLLSSAFVDKLNTELSGMANGTFPTGVQPDKCPPNSSKRPNRVQQWVNVWKSSNMFKQIVHSPRLGMLVNALAPWNTEVADLGTRVAQDQVWMKPPDSAPLVFHRDTPYFHFTNNQVVTVWIALDDMEEDMGPIEYVKGSHLWKATDHNEAEPGKERGRARQFFQKDVLYFVNAARKAERSTVSNQENDEAGLIREENDLEIISMKGMRKGGISIHDGNTWHGSMKNKSKEKARRGIGIHFVPGDVKFNERARKTKLWKAFCTDTDGNFSAEVCDELFPLTSDPNYDNTVFLNDSPATALD